MNEVEKFALKWLIEAAERVGNLYADQHEGRSFNDLADAVDHAKKMLDNSK